jgi:hypothetical protein
MNVSSFYALVAATCFALTGLWWTVVKSRPEWLKDKALRSMAGGVYLSFLLPAVMSLMAEVGGDSKLIWRVIFVVAALLGIGFTGRLILKTRHSGKPGFFRRNWWLSVAVYAVILVVALFPQISFPGFQPLQIEAFLLSLLILLAHGLTWDFMTEPKEQA